MLKKKAVLLAAFVFCFVNLFSVCSIQTFAASKVLKEGMSGSDVTSLQKDLRTLGYLKVSPTGYYGSLTKSAVERLQDSNGLDGDGIAGSKTISLISKLVDAKSNTTSRSSSSSGALKEGMSGSRVTQLQSDLKKLGYLSASPTGYYGSLTKAAVKKLQKKNGLDQDGVAGDATLTKINKLIGRTSTSTKKTTASRGSVDRTGGYLVSWYGGAENILGKGDIAEVYDINTGRTFKIKRTYGHNHADCETLTAEDTKIMKSIYGGDWGWDRRPIILTVNGRKLAASMAGMPHAGVEGSPADTYVSSRSGGYGGGDNLDAVKGNKMSGVFDIHFLNSRTHGTNKVDSKHQQALKDAAEWAEKNGF
ncbi:peptidoglycan-binding domain-containing protein [Acetivibrio cellulolyticus]|uniref:peptidoglycan-binding domain-containing protein n=1 Tax=Acetivibrio cellulolyticus TaxID=35830 RepID=UPI0001E2E25E|nr:peptidoglycan-binding protein [Acetivibrio cellulolyticus]